MLRAIGLMSGTSLDGVDAAWLETDGERVGRFGPALTLAYDAGLRADLRRVLDLAPTLAADDPVIADVTTRLTRRHVEAVRAIGEPADIIGFHGQTILHQPGLHQPDRRRMWQIGDAALLARETATRAVYDFRGADFAAGGEGAPLAPAYHAALAHDLAKPVAVLNLGGVGNVTWIGAGGELVAFDTGPGNGPLDDWIARQTGEAFDRDGALSAAGRPDAEVLARLMDHAYFKRPPPKSLDRLDFSRALAASGLDALSAADGAATLVAFTVEAVARAPLPSSPLRWLVTGGGRHNPTIMAALRTRLGASVEPVEAVGWNGDVLEAQCFGFLAVRSAAGLPISYPGTTGAPRPMTGGKIATP
jgi:anhydro-N-acetylmuramic acid kinase